MKKFLIVIAVLVALYLCYDVCRYQLGWYIDFNPNKQAESFIKTEGKDILIKDGENFVPFEIKGMNLGSAIPGEWTTDYAIDKETYLRWFGQIQEMGANTIRVYSLQSSVFYQAFYEYNINNENPLYLIQGVAVNDYIQNSYRDAFDEEFVDVFISDCRNMVDAIHGNKKFAIGKRAASGSGSYLKDVSKWTIGYILGIDWESTTVAYTNQKYEGDEAYTKYTGDYLYTTGEPSAFEAMLAYVGDKAIEYEAKKYKEQRLISFSNHPMTDPFDYPQSVMVNVRKHSKVDVEKIRCTDKVVSGQFASYHVYPYYPDFLKYMDDWSSLGIEKSDNNYRSYLTALNNYHSYPVVIAEFGIPAGRGISRIDGSGGRNMGNMSESEQGAAIASCYEDIKAAGCTGSCLFIWQDEWLRRTWNTMYAVDTSRSAYWSDFQTSGQYFGMLAMDTGNPKSISYVDGDVSEWKDNDILLKNNNISLSLKYDEKFIYLLVNKKDFDLESEIIYIPIDVTPKSGSNYCENFDIRFSNEADFLVIVNGKDESRVMVQKRYEALRSTYSDVVYSENAYDEEHIPDKATPEFVNIDMFYDVKYTIVPAILNVTYESMEKEPFVFETGNLRYGNANPESADFDSLADFCVSGDYIEIKLPWQLLNFADPSRMMIHDDYYDGNYGVEYIEIDGISIGVGLGDNRIPMEFAELEGWGNKPTYHERLKSSYYVMKELWNK